MSTPRSRFLTAIILALAPGLLSASGSDTERVLNIKSSMWDKFQITPWHAGGAPGSNTRFEKTNLDPRGWKEGEWLTFHFSFSNSLKFKFHSEGDSGLYGFVMRKEGQEHPNVVFVYQPNGGWYIYSDVNDASRIKFTEFEFNKDQSELKVKGNFIY